MANKVPPKPAEKPGREDAARTPAPSLEETLEQLDKEVEGSVKPVKESPHDYVERRRREQQK
jgi:hypothetical protein